MRHHVVVTLVGLLASCLVCAACGKKTDATKESAAASGTAAVMTSGNVAITVDQDGFKPSSIKLQKGAPASLVFTRTSDDTCATEVVFPQLEIKKALPKNQPVAITIPTDKEQTISFQCGMGMYKSSVVVSAAN